MEAAANTVRLWSWADADEKTDPLRIARVTNNPASRCMGALRARSRLCSRAKSGIGQVWNATGGSAAPLVPATYGQPGYRAQNHNRLTVWVKALYAEGCTGLNGRDALRPRGVRREDEGSPPGQASGGSCAGSFDRQDRDRDRILLDSADLQHKRACRNLVLHRFADAIAVGGAAERLWLQGVSVLHHVDPAAGRQADRIRAGLRRSLETREAGKGALLRRAFRRQGQFGLGRRA